MRQNFVFLMLVSALFSLSACQTASKGSSNVTTAQASQRKQPQDFLTLGRDLSKGQVDLFRPGTDFLPDTAPGVKHAPPKISPIPGNTNIIVNDPSVTIYSLDTILIGEVEAMPLPPVGLPDLQPPVNLMTDYPSPFESNKKK